MRNRTLIARSCRAITGRFSTVPYVDSHVDPAITLAIEKRLRNVYKHHGTQAARNLAKRILGRWLSREELRFLCWIEKDDEGYTRAVEAHRLAWDQTGWKARSWWKEPAGE